MSNIEGIVKRRTTFVGICVILCSPTLTSYYLTQTASLKLKRSKCLKDFILNEFMLLAFDRFKSHWALSNRLSGFELFLLMSSLITTLWHNQFGKGGFAVSFYVVLNWNATQSKAKVSALVRTQVAVWALPTRGPLAGRDLCAWFCR